MYEPEDRVMVRTTEYDVKCNSKIYFEGFGEGYHVPFVHKGTLIRHPVSGLIFGRGRAAGQYTAHSPSTGDPEHARWQEDVSGHRRGEGDEGDRDVVSRHPPHDDAELPHRRDDLHHAGIPDGPESHADEAEILFPKAIAARPTSTRSSRAITGMSTSSSWRTCGPPCAAPGARLPDQRARTLPDLCGEAGAAFDDWLLDQVLDPA